MSVRHTLDTNLLIYAADTAGSPLKHLRSLELLRHAARTRQPLALQALNEFCYVMTRKKIVSFAELRVAVAEHTSTFEIIAPAGADIVDALDLHGKTRYSYFDCLLLATMARAGCQVFFSEDMQDGFRVGALEIVNPSSRTEHEVALLLGV